MIWPKLGLGTNIRSGSEMPGPSAKMQGNMDKTFQEERYAAVRWGLDGLASQLGLPQGAEDENL